MGQELSSGDGEKHIVFIELGKGREPKKVGDEAASPPPLSPRSV